jgi:mannose-6-phosphate isomerase-like protein (cupin superfamily)
MSAGPPVKVVNVARKLSLFHETWSPRIIAELNGQQVRLAKLKGEFVWHRHENEDELFLVVRGRLELRFREGTVTLNEGELAVVPRGVEHLPVAEEEAHVLLLEPAATVNTGDAAGPRTVPEPEWI